jgi:hypothetical protein
MFSKICSEPRGDELYVAKELAYSEFALQRVERAIDFVNQQDAPLVVEVHQHPGFRKE